MKNNISFHPDLFVNEDTYFQYVALYATKKIYQIAMPTGIRTDTENSLTHYKKDTMDLIMSYYHMNKTFLSLLSPYAELNQDFSNLLQDTMNNIFQADFNIRDQNELLFDFPDKSAANIKMI